MAMTTTITGMIMDTVMDMDMMAITDTKGRDTLIIMHMVTRTGRMVTNTAKMDTLIITSIRRKATTMAVTTTTTTVRLQRRENKRKNKVRAALLLLMAAANKEGTR